MTRLDDIVEVKRQAEERLAPLLRGRPVMVRELLPGGRYEVVVPETRLAYTPEKDGPINVPPIEQWR